MEAFGLGALFPLPAHQLDQSGKAQIRWTCSWVYLWCWDTTTVAAETIGSLQAGVSPSCALLLALLFTFCIPTRGFHHTSHKGHLKEPAGWAASRATGVNNSVSTARGFCTHSWAEKIKWHYRKSKREDFQVFSPFLLEVPTSPKIGLHIILMLSILLVWIHDNCYMESRRLIRCRALTVSAQSVSVEH